MRRPVATCNETANSAYRLNSTIANRIVSNSWLDDLESNLTLGSASHNSHTERR
jgi:hypothetical protein